MDTCRVCGGIVEHYAPPGLCAACAGLDADDNECPDCRGTGIGWPVERACSVCGGSGVRRRAARKE